MEELAVEKVAPHVSLRSNPGQMALFGLNRVLDLETWSL